MGDYGNLASTGAGITIAGVFINQLWLLAIAIGLMLIGAMLIRVAWRPGLTIAEPQPLSDRRSRKMQRRMERANNR